MKRQSTVGSTKSEGRRDRSVAIANEFLIRKLKQGCEENVMGSPFSFGALLSMVASGTTGQTLKQILEFLGCQTIEELNGKFSSIMAFASDDKIETPILVVSDALWLDQKFRLQGAYQKVLEDVFKAQARNADFSTQADEVAEEFNAWVSSATKGLITNVLKSCDISPSTILLLANAIYFKGFWQKSFRKDLTKKSHFYLRNGSEISVSFMTDLRGSYCGYRSFSGYKVLKLPYKRQENMDYSTQHQFQGGDPNVFPENKSEVPLSSSAFAPHHLPSPKKTKYQFQGGDCQGKMVFSMYFFLPNERDGLQDLLEIFKSNPELLHTPVSGIYDADMVAIEIPKFKFSCTIKEASSIMAELGLTRPFRGDMETTKMVEGKIEYPINISDIVQESCIEVDEDGTTAAAVTYTSIGFGGCANFKPPKIAEFVADHPFMFMIKEETTGTVFFLGAVLHPISNE